ncbi:MAG: DUF1566 domain-containing protein [Pseudomonadota bacterium]
METSVGGKIQGVSLDSFLQIVQMDRITCTLKVISQEGFGFLYFVNGELFSAITGDIHNVEAACRIISWEEAVIEIDNSCDKTENDINQPLMNLLMEGMRLRDEAAKSKAKTNPDPATKGPPTKGSQPPSNTAKQAGSKPDAVTAPPPSAKTASASKKLTAGATKRSKWKIVAIGAGLSLILILGGIGLSGYLSRARQLKQNYEAVLSKVETTIPLEKKRQLLQIYLQENSGSKYTPDAEQRMKDIQEQMVQLDFSSVSREAETLAKRGDLEQAFALYVQLEERSSNSRLSSQISQKKKELGALADKRAYETLIRLSEGKGPERITLYLDFLKTHPNSSQRPQVEKLIAEMSHEFYLYAEKQILENGKLENWRKCLDIIQQYFDIYPNSENTGVLKKYQSLCEEEIIDADAFTHLLKRAEMLGENHDQILKIYTDYLRSYPHTRAKNKIDQEIEKNKALSEKKRLASEILKMTDLLSGSAERFAVQPNGTVKDGKTGLMWNLIDSTTLLNRCIDYKEALNFVKTLNTGGYTDWRLPAPEELTTLYRQKPSFPSTAPTWYWTSQTHKRYLGRWMVDVDVVSTETSTEEEVKNKESWHCGAVRAVRGNK